MTKKVKKIHVNSFDELMSHEKEIIKRIAKTSNGGNLFMAHPFMLLDDIGVEISETAKKEIIKKEPHLSVLSSLPYEALKKYKGKQSTRYHIKGLFKRRSK